MLQLQFVCCWAHCNELTCTFSLSQPVDVMLEFEGDVAVVDGLVHGETYIVEISAVDGGRIIHSFPPVQIYIS